MRFAKFSLKNDLIVNELKIKLNSSSALANVARSLGAVDSSLDLGIVNIESDYAMYGLTSGNLYEGLEDSSKVQERQICVRKFV